MTLQSRPPSAPLIPETAPFTDEQRAWLNGFFAGVFSLDHGAAPVALPPAAGVALEAPPAAKGPLDDGDDGSAPWHDPALPRGERMQLAEGRPLRRRMMAAMAQQDCGQCGYTCSDYADALFLQSEPRLNLCVPGGKETARALKSLFEEMGGGVIDPEKAAAAALSRAAKAPAEGAPGRSREQPVVARLRSRTRLNKADSQKRTYHVEIDLSGTGLDYQVGDSLGVIARNDPALVDAILAAVAAPIDFPIAGKPLRDALIEDANLAPAPDALFTLISYLVGGERRRKAQALAKGQDPDGDAASLDVLAAIEKFPGIRPDPEAFYEALDPLQPRLYSISSSPRADPGGVSLTVDAVSYEIAGRLRQGLASMYLAERMQPGSPLGVYVQKAHGFALPKDDATPIVMVGPGTGIAPFRAFLQDRMATRAGGKAWLFFGHQRQASDFFYQEELQAFRHAGVLTRLSLAWSRDGEGKVYVQDRMREEGAELLGWLEAGAHFYVCGDAKRMAKDVETALADIVCRHGGKPAEAAQAYVAELKAKGRYQADVY